MKKKNKIILPLITTGLTVVSVIGLSVSLSSCVDQNQQETIQTTSLNEQVIDNLYTEFLNAKIVENTTTINEANQILLTLKPTVCATINVQEKYLKSISALNNNTVQILFNNDVLISMKPFKTINWDNVVVSRNSILLTKANLFKNNLIAINQKTANKLYDTIFGNGINQIQFGAFSMQQALILLQANKTNIETNLSLISNSISSININNTNSIVITFNANLVDGKSATTDATRNYVVVSSTTNTITLTKQGMFLENLKDVSNQQANQIYTTIFGTTQDKIQFNQITKEAAQTFLNNKVSTIQTLLNIPNNSIAAITPTATNNITIYFNSNLFNPAKYTTDQSNNSVSIIIEKNYISLTKDNMFIPSIIEFNQYNIENLYYAIFGIENNKIPFGNLTVQQANAQLPKLKNSIENTIGALPNSITNITATTDNILIVFNKNIFKPFEYTTDVNLNNVIFNITANQIKITKTGMFVRELITINQTTANNLYTAIFGNNPNQIEFGKTPLMNAITKLPNLKNAIATALSLGVDSISDLSVVDKNTITIEFNSRLFNATNITTSPNNNSVAITVDVSKITLTKAGMLANNPSTFDQNTANRIYDAIFNKNAFSYGITTVQQANLRLNELIPNLETAIGENAKIKSISIPTNDRIEITLSTPNIYPNNSTITSTDKNLVSMSFNVDRIQINKPGMFNTTPANFLLQTAQSISDAIFNLGSIDLGMDINLGMNNLEQNKKQISDAIVQAVAGSIQVQDIWVVNENQIQIKLANNPFANNSLIDVIDKNNNKYTLGSVNNTNDSYIYLQSNNNAKPIFSLIQLTKQQVVDYYNLLNSKLAINGTNSKSNANSVYNRIENKQAVANMFNFPVKYIKSIGVYNNYFDLWLLSNIFSWTGTIDFGADINNNKTEYLTINYSNRPQGGIQQTLRVQNYTNKLFS